jgi:hypothetical protein
MTNLQAFIFATHAVKKQLSTGPYSLTNHSIGLPLMPAESHPRKSRL